jgi:hypothetical protein
VNPSQTIFSALPNINLALIQHSYTFKRLPPPVTQAAQLLKSASGGKQPQTQRLRMRDRPLHLNY